MADRKPTIDFQIQGLPELVEYVESMDRKLGKRLLQKATADAAKKVLKPKVKAATPWASMKRAVRAGAAKRDKPAGIVKYDPKRAWYRHFLISGTQGHSTKRKRPNKSDIQAFGGDPPTKFSRGHDVSGVKGNPIITKVADAYGDEALEHLEMYLIRELQLED